MPSYLLATSGLTVGALLTAFLALIGLAINVLTNVQRGRELLAADRARELERCREEKKALEMAFDIESARYVRLLRQRDEEIH